MAGTKGRHWKKLHQAEYDRIRKLIELGIKGKALRTTTGRGSSLITWVRNHPNWVEMRDTSETKPNARRNDYTTPETYSKLVSVLDRIADSLSLIEYHMRPEIKTQDDRRFNIFKGGL